MQEYEANNPAFGDYLNFVARVSCGGFAGRTDFWVTLPDWDAFVAALTALDQSLHGVAELVCGWGADEYIRLRIEPFGRSGRLVVRIALAYLGLGSGGFNTMQTAFVVLPNALTEFRSGLSALLVERRLGEVQLIGDPEAAV